MSHPPIPGGGRTPTVHHQSVLSRLCTPTRSCVMMSLTCAHLSCLSHIPAAITTSKDKVDVCPYRRVCWFTKTRVFCVVPTNHEPRCLLLQVHKLEFGDLALGHRILLAECIVYGDGCGSTCCNLVSTAVGPRRWAARHIHISTSRSKH
jgi:hypothetical protein